MPLGTVLGQAWGQQSKVSRQQICTVQPRNSRPSCFNKIVLKHPSRSHLTRAAPEGHNDQQSEQQLDRNTQQLDDILAGLVRLREQQHAGQVQVQDDEDEDLDDEYEFPPAAEGITWGWWRADDSEAAAAEPSAAGAVSSSQQESPAVHSSQVPPAQQQQQEHHQAQDQMQQPQQQQQRQMQPQQLSRPAVAQSGPAGVGSRVRRRRTQQQPGQ